MQDFLGGSPLSILVKLIFLSLLVGAFLAFLDVTPIDLGNRLLRTFRSMFGLSFEALQDIGRWILYGAMIVVPIWFLLRLFRTR
jgi:hypothetical protein